MGTQETLIQRYKRIYPDRTMKDTAKATGIQTTRVFRIFNGGYEMKISEYRLLEKELMKIQGEDEAELLSLTEECLLTLNKKEISTLFNEMKRKLQMSLLITA